MFFLTDDADPHRGGRGAGEFSHYVGLATTARHLEQAKFLGIVKELPGYHHVWAWQTPWEKDAVLLTVWCDMAMVTKEKIRWIPLPGEPILAEDPMFIYLPIRSIPKELNPLPFDLRPR